MLPTSALGLAALVVDTAAHPDDAALELTRQTLAAAGLPLGRSVAVRDPAMLGAVVKQAALEGHGLVVVGADDPALGSAAGTLADLPSSARPALGVLPLGLTNHVARTLTMPRRLSSACAAIAEGQVVRAHLGRAGGVPFLHRASLGPVRAPGPAALLRRGLPRASGRRDQPFRARLEFPRGPRATLELDDLLQLTVRAGRTLDLRAVRRRRPARPWAQHVTRLGCESVRLTTYDGRRLLLDATVAVSTPVLVEVEPDVLDVVVPVQRGGRGGR